MCVPPGHIIFLFFFLHQYSYETRVMANQISSELISPKDRPMTVCAARADPMNELVASIKRMEAKVAQLSAHVFGEEESPEDSDSIHGDSAAEESAPPTQWTAKIRDRSPDQLNRELVPGDGKLGLYALSYTESDYKELMAAREPLSDIPNLDPRIFECMKQRKDIMAKATAFRAGQSALWNAFNALSAVISMAVKEDYHSLYPLLNRMQVIIGMEMTRMTTKCRNLGRKAIEAPKLPMYEELWFNDEEE